MPHTWLECTHGVDEAVVAANTQALMLHIQEPALAAAAGAGEVGEAPARDREEGFLVQGLRAPRLEMMVVDAPAAIGAGHRDLGGEKGRGGRAYTWALCYERVHTKWSHMKLGRIN
jgi:hypothetical protein